MPRAVGKRDKDGAIENTAGTRGVVYEDSDEWDEWGEDQDQDERQNKACEAVSDNLLALYTCTKASPAGPKRFEERGKSSKLKHISCSRGKSLRDLRKIVSESHL